MNRRLLVVLVCLWVLCIAAQRAGGGWCATQPAAVAAFNGWEPCEDAPHIMGYYVNGVQVGAWNAKTHIWRTYDRASDKWGPPSRAPWKVETKCVEGCECECCQDDCKCKDGKPCGCNECRCVVEAVKNPKLALDLPAEVREWYRNPDGSCVQCSIGMCGVDQNVPEAATLLWDTDYGPAERGGSYPQRVAEYAKRRGMKIYNVTGENTWDWMKWACMTGRGCAIGAGASHFQTLAGYDPETKTYAVVNNNSPQRVDTYGEEQFRRLHLASGQWVVVLDYPPHPERPVYQKWWNGFGKSCDCGCDKNDCKDCGGACQRSHKAAAPEVEREAILRLGNMVQRIGGDEIGDENSDFVEAMAPPADDSGKWFIYVITSNACPPCSRLKKDWASNDDLRAFAKPDDAKNSWAHFTVYDKDDETQSWRFRGIKVDSYPTIVIQPPRSGAYGDPKTVVFQRAGYDGNAHKLAQAMSSAIKRYVQSLPKKGTAQRTPPFRPAPKPSPVTPPDITPPNPGPGPSPNIPPDPAPSPEPTSDFPWQALAAAVVLVAAFVKGQMQ